MERDIIHRCGHVERRFLAGYWVCDKERDAVRLERLKCTACTTDAKRAASAARAAAARELTGDMLLPPLTGSPRQVAWADGIRAEKLAALRRTSPTAVAAAKDVVEARWWIDHRSANAVTLEAALYGGA